jgi:hypothetical protein
VTTQEEPGERLKAGESDERVFAVAAWREAPYFTDAERAALALDHPPEPAHPPDPPPGADPNSGLDWLEAWRVNLRATMLAEQDE